MQGGLGVVIKGKEVFLFYQLLNKKDKSIYIAKSKDGDTFVSSKIKPVILNHAGKKETVKNCSDFHFFQNNDEYILRYTLLFRKKKYYCEAVSKTLLRWKVRKKTDAAPGRSIVVSGLNYKRQAVRYGGKGSLYVGFQNKLKRQAVWENDPVPVLEPRTGYFDDSALEIAGVDSVKEGILLTYYNRHLRRDHNYFTLGAAILDKKNPAKVSWRSPLAVWEQPEEWDNRKIYFIGSVHLKNKLIFYWGDKKGLIMSVIWPYQDFIKAMLNGKLSPVLSRHAANPIISPDVKSWWESKATMNAAAIRLDGRTHLLYRAIGDTDYSMLGYASSADGTYFDEKLKYPVYIPREPFEGVGERPVYIDPRSMTPYISGGGGSGGCEDPRLTRIDDTVYMTYVAYNGYSAPGVAISSIKVSDFLNKNWLWKKPRLLSAPGKIEKNWVIFPEKINGKYAILHSIAPKISIDYVNDLEDEKISIISYRYNNGMEKRWDNMMRGVGAPPIKTKYGWLLFYHAMDKNDPNRYKVGAMILDSDNPEKILYRSNQPVLEPDQRYENEGHKWGVVYVCGVAIAGNELYVYYGGADKVLCVATAKLDDFLDNMARGEDFRIHEVHEVKILK